MENLDIKRPFENQEEPEIPEELKEGSDVLINTKQESVQIKLPNGMEIVLGSGIRSVDELLSYIPWILENTQTKKENGKGSYVG